VRKLFALGVVLAAMAASAQAHQITLTWTASASSGVAGYDVYRAPCSAVDGNGNCTATGTFAQVNGALVAATTYADLNLSAGYRYVYYVVAVCPASPPYCSQTTDANGNTITVEGSSDPSGSVTATIRPGIPALSAPVVN
jgi:hypothetical protein